MKTDKDVGYELSFNDLFDHFSDGIALIEVSDEEMPGKYIKVNEAFCKRLGYSKHELICMPVMNFINQEQKNKIPELADELKSKGYARTEWTHVTKNGNHCSVVLNARLLTINGNKLVIIMIRSLINNKRSDKSLKEIEELFIMISENSHDIISYHTPDGVCQYISPAVRSLLGYEPSEFIGTHYDDFLHPEDKKAMVEQHISGDSGLLSYRVRHKQGYFIWFESSFKMIRNEDGEEQYIIGIGRDITGRKIAEEDLRQSEERFRSAFDHAPIGMALVSLNGHWIKVNRALCNIVGYSERELLETGYQDITHTDDVQQCIQFIDQLLNHRSGHYFLEKRYIHKRGSVVWALLGVSLIQDESGQPLYFIAQIEDITDKKKLEELRSQQEELIQRTDKLSMIGQLAAGIAHEIRNPLTTIRGFIQLLDQKNTTHSQGYYRIILDELDRANDIISDFLALSKNRTVEKRMCSLNGIIKALFPIVSAEAILKGHEVQLELDETISDLLLDDKEIKQLLLNLLRNGMEAMEEGGTLTLLTKSVRGRVELQISDTGCGIPEERMAELFEPFYTTKEKGTGLGLTVCQSIVEKHGGNMIIKSEESKGTTIIITL